MPQTQTIYVNFRRLNNSSHASVVLRLMMAFNDIALANQSLAGYKREQPPIRRHVQWGAKMYFVRLQCGHLNEAIRIVGEIKDDAQLLSKANRCSEDAQLAFRELISCLESPGGNQFRKYVGRVRNKSAFHYDPDMALAALRDRARREEAVRSSITRGDELALWRFVAADHIFDSIICRQLWEIPRAADLRQETDRISDYCSNLCAAFLTFVGEFTFSYIQDHGMV